MAGISGDIKGYRDLSEEEIILINRVKDFEVEFGGLWRMINGLDNTDKRWSAISKTHIEEGCSALIRSVARPDSAFDY